MTVQPVVKKYKMGEQPSDYSYWKTQPPAARLAALEIIRQEYNDWRYGAQTRFQRVYRIVKRK